MGWADPLRPGRCPQRRAVWPAVPGPDAWSCRCRGQRRAGRTQCWGVPPMRVWPQAVGPWNPDLLVPYGAGPGPLCSKAMVPRLLDSTSPQGRVQTPSPSPCPHVEGCGEPPCPAPPPPRHRPSVYQTRKGNIITLFHLKQDFGLNLNGQGVHYSFARAKKPPAML